VKGSPLAHFGIVLACVVLAAIPVWWLTSSSRVVPAALSASNPEGGIVSAELSVECTLPATVVISLEGQTLLEGDLAGGVVAQAAFKLPAGGADLVAMIRPNGEGRMAVRVVVSRDGEALADQSLWGESEMVEAISVGAAR